MKEILKEHPPTLAAAVSAFLAALAADVMPIVNEWFPALSQETVTLLGVTVLGIAGGFIGKLSEKYTMPWPPPPPKHEGHEE